MRSTAANSEPCIDPLPQDHRFVDESWRQWPYNFIYQAFLLQQQWWHNATTGVRGVSKGHGEIVEFVTRQLLDTLAPSNFPLTNPEVLRETTATAGFNLVAG
jgi:polyhydroxyalkanoate synthase subunit PhaC